MLDKIVDRSSCSVIQDAAMQRWGAWVVVLFCLTGCATRFRLPSEGGNPWRAYHVGRRTRALLRTPERHRPERLIAPIERGRELPRGGRLEVRPNVDVVARTERFLLHRALGRAPGCGNCVSGLAQAAEQQRNFGAAETLYLQAIRLTPEYAPAVRQALRERLERVRERRVAVDQGIVAAR